MDNIDNLLLDLNKEISGITTFDIDNLDEIINDYSKKIYNNIIKKFTNNSELKIEFFSTRKEDIELHNQDTNYLVVLEPIIISVDSIDKTQIALRLYIKFIKEKNEIHIEHIDTLFEKTELIIQTFNTR
jgi:intergrase/recombinase